MFYNLIERSRAMDKQEILEMLMSLSDEAMTRFEEMLDSLIEPPASQE